MEDFEATSLSNGNSNRFHQQGFTSSHRSRTMKEYDHEIDDLTKENFDLKLRLYFLEEQMEKEVGSKNMDLFGRNFQLGVENDVLKKKNEEFLAHIHYLERKRAVFQDSNLQQENFDRLKNTIQEKDRELENQRKTLSNLQVKLHNSEVVEKDTRLQEFRMQEMQREVNRQISVNSDLKVRLKNMDTILESTNKTTKELNIKIEKLKEKVSKRDILIQGLCIKIHNGKRVKESCPFQELLSDNDREKDSNSNPNSSREEEFNLKVSEFEQKHLKIHEIPKKEMCVSNHHQKGDGYANIDKKKSRASGESMISNCSPKNVEFGQNVKEEGIKMKERISHHQEPHKDKIEVEKSLCIDLPETFKYPSRGEENSSKTNISIPKKDPKTEENGLEVNGKYVVPESVSNDRLSQCCPIRDTIANNVSKLSKTHNISEHFTQDTSTLKTQLESSKNTIDILQSKLKELVNIHEILLETFNRSRSHTPN